MRDPGGFDRCVESVNTLLPERALDRVRDEFADWPLHASTAGAALRALIQRLPDELAADPWLLAATGASFHAIDSASRSAAPPYFELAETGLSRAELPASERADILTHHAAALISLHRFDEAAELLARAERLVLEPNGGPVRRIVAARARAAQVSGILLLHQGENGTARAQLRLALGFADEALGEPERVETLAALAYLNFLEGRFDDAELRISQAKGLDPRILASGFACLLPVVRLLLAIERGDHPGVLGLRAEVQQRSARTPWAPYASLALASVHLLDGGNVEGLELLSRPTSHAVHAEEGIAGHSAALHAEFLVRLGDISAAQALVHTLTQSPDHALCPNRQRAALLLAADDADACLELTAECLALGETHSPRTLLAVLYLDAAAHEQRGEHVAADISFDRALLVATRLGVHGFATLMPPRGMPALVMRALDRSQPDAVHPLLSTLRGGGWAPNGPALEPLSRRELEIVEQLTLQRTTDQIARALYISTNTVKTHVRSIYRKLDASSREDALRRLRQLGLVDITP